MQEAVHSPPSSDTDEEREYIWNARQQALSNRRNAIAGEMPTLEILTELDEFLSSELDNKTVLGRAYKFLVVDDLPDSSRIERLRKALKNESSGYANQLGRELEAIRFGVLPAAPTVAALIRGRLRGIAKRAELSEEAAQYLRNNASILDDIISDNAAQEKEADQAAAAEKTIEQTIRGKGGVYVFTFPHYLLYPTHPSSKSEKIADRTLMKIGHASSDMLKRINNETSVTAVPEHRRILRAYIPSSDKASPKACENKFFGLLDKAGHQGPKRGSIEKMVGGREWFATSLGFLDEIADFLNLEIIKFDEHTNE